MRTEPPDNLFAKSLPHDWDAGTPPPQSVFLCEHLRDAYAAADQLIVSTAELQLAALGLDPSTWMSRFQRLVKLAAGLHDLGKANDHFQRMVQRFPGWRDRRQGLRHEWVTVYLLQELECWLHDAVDGAREWQILRWTISGHHPGYHRPSPPRTAGDGGGSQMTLYVNHDDFRQCLEWLALQFSLPQPPEFSKPDVLPLVGPGNVFGRIAQPHRQDLHEWSTWQNDGTGDGGEWIRFVAAVKNCLIAADLAGSALPREMPDAKQRAQWIPAAFQQVPTPEQLEEIITDRLTSNGMLHGLRPFQRAVAEKASDVTLIRAGCGSGKTLAAYHWARTVCPRKRLYLCYPTTGTATEGFRDYLVSGEAARFQAELFHGRAAVDLSILQVSHDSEHDDDDALARIDALDAWSTPIVSCTVDTVLGLVQNNRRGLFAWPALAGAACVFDEIHAYDDRLYGALLRFLSALPGVPILLMTASLPEHRRQSLEACLSRRQSTLAVIPGPEDLEKRSRYHRLGKIDDQDPLAEIQSHIKTEGANAKVLWVCNTVDRVMDAAERAADMNPRIYHSRFRYEDRVQRHKDIIEAFHQDGPVLAVCSQVAEMSLDLSATLLVTDLAPVPALIQRLGRLNRRAHEGDPTHPFRVVDPRRADGSPLVHPYMPEDFELARSWLEKLPAEQIRQRDLSEVWESLGEVGRRRPALIPSAWLDGGPVTQVLELRDVSPGVTVILDRDLPALTHPLAEKRKTLAEVLLPMPSPPRYLQDCLNKKRFNGIPVVPDTVIDYDPQRGARWQKYA